MIKSVLLSGLLLMAGHEAQAACSFQKIAELHVVVENNQILIPGTLGGKPVKFLFDTSFPTSLLPKGAAARLDVPVSNITQPVTFMTLAGLVTRDDGSVAEVQQLTLDGMQAPIRDTIFRVFGSAETKNFGAPDVAGLLGADFWSGYEVEVDLPHNLINLFRTQDCAASVLAYWSNSYNVVDIRHDGLYDMLPVKLDGHDLTAVLDTGSRYSALTDKAAAMLGAKRDSGATLAVDDRDAGTQTPDLPALTRIAHGLGLDQQSPEVRSLGLQDMGSGEPARDYWVAHFRNMAIDEEVISPFSLRVVHLPHPPKGETGTLLSANTPHYDVLLGVDFLQSHRVLIANSQNKVYFTYTGVTKFAKPS